MDQKRRLSALERMLARLTGTETQPLEVPATPAVSQVIEQPQVAQLPDPGQRKLQLLQSMLSKLQGS